MGHVLLYENTAFGCLNRNSDDDALEKLDFVCQPIDGIGERVEIGHRRDEAAECVVSVNLSLNSLRSSLEIVSAPVRAMIMTDPYLIR